MQSVNIITLTEQQLQHIVESAVKRGIERYVEQQVGPTSEQLLTRADVMKLLNISPATLNTYIRTGELPARKIGKRVMFMYSEILENMKSVHKTMIR